MSYADKYKAAKDAGQTTELTATFHDFKKDGESVIGKLISRHEVKGKQNGNPYNHYIMETDAGNVKFFCGSVFDNETGNAMEIGGIYAVHYMGQETVKGGNKVNKFSAELIELPRMGA